ncbi:MAG: TonB-dependent receptor [Bryobacterales bacterium]|nr:TonB-dependent receptor [Bryobacterales bacterium]
MWRLGLLFLLALSSAAAQVRGVVRDAGTGEALSRVAVQVAGTEWGAVTDNEGRFLLPAIAPGEHTLTVSTVGYRMLRRPFTLQAGSALDFDILLQPEILRRKEELSVDAGPFELERADVPSQRTLSGTEARNLASVLADDPLRAVQGLPGVASNDDFNARFALRGADYRRLGLYLDGVLLHQPFHSIQGEGASGSLTLLNGDLLEQMSLYPSAWPVKFGDRTAGILDLGLREGSRRQILLRGSVSASNASLTAEGPLDRKRRGSWLLSTRKSYLQYIINRTAPNTPLTFGFIDGQARLTWDFTSKHRGGLSIIDGYSSGDRSRNRDRLGANAVMEAEYRSTLLTADWRYTPRSGVLATSRLAWMRERFENRNRELLPLAGGHYGEWVWNAGLTAMVRGRHAFDAGASVRRLRDAGFTNQYQFNPFAVRPLNNYRGGPRVSSAYLQQQWTAGRIHLTGGARLDRHSVVPQSALSPYAAAGLRLWRGASFDAGWGQAVQWPEPLFLYSVFGNRALLAERATHVTAGLEQRLDQRTRLRVEAYQRADRDLLFRSLFEPRLIGNTVFNPPVNAPVRNSLRGYARGVEVFLQRRSANKLTGWVSYAYGAARQRDAVAGSFYADFDQRHTANVYAGYRLRPTANLSARLTYGSGFPIPGFLLRNGNQYMLARQRNGSRLDPYARVDVRANKDFTFDRWKLTLYAEAVNVTNRANYRFDSFNGYNVRTGQAFVGLDQMFPILPSAGLVLEFSR